MDRKTIGIMIIISALILMIAIIYLVFFHDFDKEEVVDTPLVQEEKTSGLPIQEEKIIEEAPAPPINKEVKVNVVRSEDLKKIASSFTERFGSYSNHSDFSNILDLRIFMTESMKKWADKYVEELRGNNSADDIYFGVTTKSVSSEENFFDDYAGEAEILVKTQRKESTGTMKNSRVYYQNILISFIKEKGAWKVDSAYWQ
jgi:hypothetical protein